MKANYGYADGSGEFFIQIDSVRCDGCGDCVPACPAGVLVVGEDENDPSREAPVALVVADRRRSVGYDCAPCKTGGARPELPCVAACRPGAIAHSW